MYNKLSRRKAMKLIALSPVAASVLANGVGSTNIQAGEDIFGKIVIVGGGTGAIMTLSKLKRSIKNPDITIIAPNEKHIYQPGQIFVASGEMPLQDIILDNNDYIDTNAVKWIKDEVKTFNAQDNSVVTRNGQIISYDVLIVATGVAYHYEKIKGLTKEDIGTNGIASVYLNDLEKGTSRGATEGWTWFNELKETAKTKKPTVIYTHPNTPIKCGGAPQKVLYLSADYLRQSDLSANFIFATSNAKLFPLPKVDKELHIAQNRYDKITNKFQHHLESIDVKAKKATFIHAYEEKVFDPDLEEYEMVSYAKKVEMDYDYIHIVPPMSPVKAVMDSDLISENGWLDIDIQTLQHKKYKNIFGIGDVCNISSCKTGGAARHQTPIVIQNVLAYLKAKNITGQYDGYTACPLKTQYGKIIMAEFNYKGPAPTLPFLAYEKPRWIWWAFDLYMLKPMYQYLMLRGLF